MITEGVVSGTEKQRLWRFNRAQRLLVYVGVMFWMLASVLQLQRNYQDSWILEGALVPLALFTAVFLWVIAQEDDNRVVSLICAAGVGAYSLVPALKYQQPYGTTVDATTHFLMLKSLVEEGRVAAGSVYETIPGMHSWLATAAITGGFSAETAIRLALPMVGTIVPLAAYWIGHQAGMSHDVLKYTIASSCLTAHTFHLTSGTGFTLVTVLFLTGALVLREFYVDTGKKRKTCTIIALVCMAQVIVWHSTTPMLLPALLAVVSLTPIAVWVFRRDLGRIGLAPGLLRFTLLAAVFFMGYRLIQSDQIFEVAVETAYEMATASESSMVIPERMFEITLRDMMQVLLVFHGRDAVVMGLAAIGVVVVMCMRKRWGALMHLYAYYALILATFTVLVGAAVSGADYGRFLVSAVNVAFFFAGPSLWWIHKLLVSRGGVLGFLGKGVWGGLVTAILVVVALQFYLCQPLIPNARALTPGWRDEAVSCVNMANTAYQERMLCFAQMHSDPDSGYAIDVRGYQQFFRYFGPEAADRHGLHVPLMSHEPVDTEIVRLFLLHWPDEAGGFGEQVEDRARGSLIRLRETPGWGLVYDNGESWVLWIR